jgi:hypothetical protein
MNGPDTFGHSGEAASASCKLFAHCAVGSLSPLAGRGQRPSERVFLIGWIDRTVPGAVVFRQHLVGRGVPGLDDAVERLQMPGLVAAEMIGAATPAQAVMRQDQAFRPRTPAAPAAGPTARRRRRAFRDNVSAAPRGRWSTDDWPSPTGTAVHPASPDSCPRKSPGTTCRRHRYRSRHA